MQRFLLTGAVGSGKGTIAKKIVDHFDNFGLFCAGDVIRSHIHRETDFGKRARSFLETGEHVPDSLVNELLLKELALHQLRHQRLLLDGFPRTLTQLAAVESAAPISFCFELDVPKKVIFERLTKRWVHPGSGRTYNLDYNPPEVEGKDDLTGEPLERRIDDNDESIRRRLEVYSKTESKVAAYFKSNGNGVTVKGDSSDLIWPIVRAHLEELLQQRRVASSA